MNIIDRKYEYIHDHLSPIIAGTVNSWIPDGWMAGWIFTAAAKKFRNRN